MIRGYIRDSSCYLDVTIRGRRDKTTVEALIDTGFDGFITLPITEAEDLGLELVGRCKITLADGSVLQDEPVFDATLLWDNVWLEAEIDLNRTTETLIGAALFSGYRIILDYAVNEVLIERV